MPEEKRKALRKISEGIAAENFPNLGKEIINHVKEMQRVPGRINPRRNTPRHISKLTKIKGRENIESNRCLCCLV